MSIIFGFLVEDAKKIDAADLAEKLENYASQEEWSWVLWELNGAFYGIILGSLAFKGRITQDKTIEIISVGEAIEASEDNRSRWIFPARASGSLQEAAQKMISNFVSLAYRMSDRKEVSEVEAAAQQERKLAPLSGRRKPKAEIIRGIGTAPAPISSSNESDDSEPAVKAAPTGEIARKSRRAG